MFHPDKKDKNHFNGDVINLREAFSIVGFHAEVTEWFPKGDVTESDVDGETAEVNITGWSEDEVQSYSEYGGAKNPDELSATLTYREDAGYGKHFVARIYRGDEVIFESTDGVHSKTDELANKK